MKFTSLGAIAFAVALAAGLVGCSDDSTPVGSVASPPAPRGPVMTASVAIRPFDVEAPDAPPPRPPSSGLTTSRTPVDADGRVTAELEEGERFIGAFDPFSIGAGVTIIPSAKSVWAGLTSADGSF